MKKLLFAVLFLMNMGIMNSQSLEDVCIDVKILDGQSVILWQDCMPLIDVQTYYGFWTSYSEPFIFYYSIPDNWAITFESETISFSSIKKGHVELLDLQQGYYFEFAITSMLINFKK